MSDPENFLARWSRRKREVTESETTEHPTPDDANPADRAAEVEREPLSPAAGAASEPLVDLTRLPAIDSITAETDISGFLAPGVPAELKAAALRRAWVADSKIRDFVGLNDYDFDFHTPGAISGFGPLEMTDALRREVARIVGDLLPEPEVLPQQVAASVPASTQPSDATKEINAAPSTTLPSGGPRVSCDVDDAGVAREENEATSSSAGGNKEIAASQHNKEPRENLQSTARRSHGGALPK
jgi:hypothetical protein